MKGCKGDSISSKKWKIEGMMQYCVMALPGPNFIERKEVFYLIKIPLDDFPGFCPEDVAIAEIRFR